MRTIFAVLIALFAFLALFPERYRAAVTLTPTDPTSMGLSGTLGQLGAINSVFGSQTAVEVALKVARSQQVRDTVIDTLKLQRRLGVADRIRLHRMLQDRITIRSLRGGIIQFESLDRDQDLAHDLVEASANATQARLAEIGRRQTQYKREVLVKLVSDASVRLGTAKAAYDNFRLANRSVLPELALVNASSLVPQLEAAIRTKEIEIATARRSYTDENINVQQLLAQLSALRGQLAQAQATTPTTQDSVGQAVQASRRGEHLLRQLNIAQNLYDNYMKFLEGTDVEDLTATASVRILEPAFVDTSRQINLSFAALALTFFLLWAALEVYRWVPPVGDRMRTLTVQEEVHA